MNGAAHAFDPVRRSPAHRRHLDLGAEFVTEARWEIPASYGPEENERQVIEGGLAIADITARSKVDLRGAIDLPLSSLAEAPPGAISVATADGSAAGRMHLARVGSEWAIVLAEPDGGERCLTAVERAADGYEVLVTDVTGLYAGFALAGPRALELLSRLTALDLSGLRAGTCSAARVAEIPGILVRTAHDGIVELYVGSEYGRYAWETLLEVGEGLGGAPVGWNALRARGWW